MGNFPLTSLTLAQAPLHVAIKRRRKDLIQLLLKVSSGATRGARDGGGMLRWEGWCFVGRVDASLGGLMFCREG